MTNNPHDDADQHLPNQDLAAQYGKLLPRRDVRGVVMRAALVLVVAACDRAAPPDPCSPSALGLKTARQLREWSPPTACSVKITDSETHIVRAAADVATVFACPAATLGIDFTTNALVVTPRFLSEAMAGMQAYDDGKTITLVNRYLETCANGKHNLNESFTYVFVIPNGARAIAEMSCTQPQDCR